MGERVILFDGVCNLCHAGVRFVLRRDPAGKFRFASLQSPFARERLGEPGAGAAPRSVVYLRDGQILKQSSAILSILRDLGGGWALFGVLRVLPAPLRDGLYDFVARNRYRWFGKKDACPLPDARWNDRFLDHAPAGTSLSDQR